MPQKLRSNINIRGTVRKRKKKLSRPTVVKMLAVMEAASQTSTSNNSGNNAVGTPENPNAQEFLASGRTGRRNALPDILGQHALVTSSDLPTKLQALSTTDDSTEVEMRDQPGTSKS